MTLWEYVHSFIYVSLIYLHIKMCLSPFISKWWSSHH